MKKVLISAIAILLTTIGLQAQNANGFGFKAGLNYNGNGNYYESAISNAEHPDRNIGYHFGIFGKIGKNVFFRPELVFTNTKSDYVNNSFTMQKLDAPLLVGVNFLKLFNAFVGPSFQYIIASDFENRVLISDVKNDFTVGLNFGIGVSFNRIGIDLRYERGFSNNEATFISNNGIGISRLDTRQEQLILGISLIL